ncbi:hypothetical protein SAMN02745866_01118 [Alteromonadaceae bacterium Bs31]|nr:hypothetical protein SAMN02745866_01118 [Alteromonadaceae bacterium Bs31]
MLIRLIQITTRFFVFSLRSTIQIKCQINQETNMPYILASSKEKEEYRAYASEFIASQNQQSLDNKSACYKIDKGTKVELMLTVNIAGVISSSDTATDSRKAKCIRKAYIGARMPVPPFAPIAIRLNMI